MEVEKSYSGRLLFLFLLFISIIYTGNSQTISYILPDIGSPGMNVYMEIIAPTDAMNNFGADGLTIDPYNSTTLSVEFQNLNDTNIITFGQMIVSWGGRMISAQVFINPFMNTPNSSKWNELSSEFIIPFRIKVNGIASNYVNYYIVKPYDFGDLTSVNESVFGEGNLGIRSPRGAMIVDSLILGARTYTVSTNDCDPTLAGNQGYLPFVLLSKNNINGVSSPSSIISVNGGAPNAGPGGGGGGGNFCDGSLSNPLSGSDGGNGFVGGGPGGRNGSWVSNRYEEWGQGTGISSNSINGVPRPVTGWYEASGGATGHPFGFSGKGVFVNGSVSEDPVNNAGGYGGGTGEDQNTKGGGGGYATAGQGSDSYNAGRIHGNDVVVPIAGGSGGASGNPNNSHECSGNGGGGGGAISVFAKKISNCSITANGGNGQDGNSNSDGGGGSGGYVGVFAKIRAELIAITANSGATPGFTGTNGAGRLRMDIFKEGLGISSAPANASIYKAMTTDANYLVYRKFDFKITKPANIQIDVYLKSATTNWTLIATDNSANTIISVPMNLSGTDTVYYLNVVQTIPAPTGYIDVAQYKPTHILSQAAANVFIIDKYPEIGGDSAVTIGSYNCPNMTVVKTIKLFNKGKAPLNINFTPSGSGAYLKNETPGLYWSPLTNISVLPNDTTTVTISYLYQDGDSGVITDTLYITHNDKTAEHKPWIVGITIELEKLKVEFRDKTALNSIDEINLGKICSQNILYDTISVINLSDFLINIDELTLSNGTNFTAILLDNPQLDVNASSKIALSFTANSSGEYIDTIFVTAKECPTYLDKIILKASISEPKIEFEMETIDLGLLCPTKSTSKQFIIRNVGDVEADISHFIITGSSYTAQILDNPIIPVGGSAIIEVTFDNPSYPAGVYIEQMIITDANCPNFTASVNIKTEIVSPSILLSGANEFPLTKVGSTVEQIVTLTNTGNSTVYIENAPILPSPFLIVSSAPALPTYLNAGEKIEFTIRFAPIIAGVFDEVFEIITSESGSFCLCTASIHLTGQAELPKIILSKYTADFGTRANCNIVLDTIYVIDQGKFLVTVNSASIVGPDRASFKIISEPDPPVYSLDHMNDSARYIIEFDASIGLIGPKVAQLTFDATDPIPVCNLIGETMAIDISFDPVSPINWGAIPVGQSANIDINITNNNSLPIVISSFTMSGSDITVTPSSISLNANETKSIQATITANQAGSLTYTIQCDITSPCPETRIIEINAIGLEGKIAYTNYLDYKVLAPCKTKIETVIIENTGDADIKIVSTTITGTNQSLFILQNPLSAEQTLAPGGVLELYILYDPFYSTDGIHTAKLDIQTVINGQSVKLVTQLRGERRSGLLSIPSNVLFNSVRINKTLSMGVELSNIGVQPITILNMVLPYNPAIFKVTPSSLNITMLATDIVNLSVEFTPVEIKNYSDSITILYSVDGCLESIRIYLLGTGVPAKVVHVRLPIIENADPAANELKIPIYAKIDDAEPNDVLSGIRLTLDIELNRLLYYPISILPSTNLMSYSFDNLSGNRIISITANNISLYPSETVIAEIVGYPLLGDAQSTNLYIRKIEAENNPDISTFTYEEGSISYKICSEGSDRLLSYKEPMMMKISPNPSGSNVSISINTIEKGQHQLKLVDVNGKVNTILNKYFDGKNESSTDLQLNTNEMSNGVYLLILSGPNRAITQKLFILK